MMAIRYKVEFKPTGKKNYVGFPNASSFGLKTEAFKFMRRIKKAYHEVGRTGIFRVKTALPKKCA